jgi:hypothetical protein
MSNPNSSKTSHIMNMEETNRIIQIVKEAIKSNRTKREIVENFRDAGIIDKNGDLKTPYKKIYIPVEK